MEGTTTPQLLTVDEVAHILRVDRKLAYRLIREGKIPSVRLSERGIRVNADVLAAILGQAA